MTEPPPLPGTDDPFELLGVPPTTDDKALRRAYRALIKVYKPERAPDAFRRIREAYEEASSELAFRAVTSTPPVDAPTRGRPTAEVDPEEAARAAEEHRLAREARNERARRTAAAVEEVRVALRRRDLDAAYASLTSDGCLDEADHGDVLNAAASVYAVAVLEDPRVATMVRASFPEACDDEALLYRHDAAERWPDLVDALGLDDPLVRLVLWGPVLEGPDQRDLMLAVRDDPPYGPRRALKTADRLNDISPALSRLAGVTLRELIEDADPTAFEIEYDPIQLEAAGAEYLAALSQSEPKRVFWVIYIGMAIGLHFAGLPTLLRWGIIFVGAVVVGATLMIVQTRRAYRPAAYDVTATYGISPHALAANLTEQDLSAWEDDTILDYGGAAEILRDDMALNLAFMLQRLHGLDLAGASARPRPTE